MWLVRLVGLVWMLSALVGCTGTNDPSPGPSESSAPPSETTAPATEDPGALLGDWQLTRLVTPSGEVTLDPAAPVTATFESDSMSGTSACNNYSGNYQASSDGSLTIDELMMTEMACLDGSMEIEGPYLDALRVIDSYAIEDDLELRAADGQTVLVFEQVAPPTTGDPEALLGNWQLIRLVTPAGVTPLDPSFPVLTTIEADAIYGTAACNGFDGDYQASDDGALTVKASMVTLMACQESAMTIENAFLETLTEVAYFAVDDNLNLQDARGNAVLVFERVD